MKRNNVIRDKSFQFAIRIVNLYKYLRYEKEERIIAHQIMKSGTSIGANVREALRSLTRKEFLAKMNIALRESYETEYWIELLHKTDFLSQSEFDSLFQDCRELTNILSRIILTTKESEPTL